MEMIGRDEICIGGEMLVKELLRIGESLTRIGLDWSGFDRTFGAREEICSTKCCVKLRWT